MKNVYLIGFRGTGISSVFANESPLIQVGHVGFAFENDVETIYGLHPTDQEIERQGGAESLLEHLMSNGSCAATLQLDGAIFVRADLLAQEGQSTAVWQLAIALSDNRFDAAQEKATQWYNEQKEFTYAFPTRRVELTDFRDNCATFPRRLGLPIPESSGRLIKYIPELERLGTRWKPYRNNRP
jgi:hypothetical protein